MSYLPFFHERDSHWNAEGNALAAGGYGIANTLISVTLLNVPTFDMWPT